MTALENRDAAKWIAHWVEADTLDGFYSGEAAATASVFDATHPGRFLWDAPLQCDGMSHLIISCEWSGDSADLNCSAVEGLSLIHI